MTLLYACDLSELLRVGSSWTLKGSTDLLVGFGDNIIFGDFLSFRDTKYVLKIYSDIKLQFFMNRSEKFQNLCTL